MIQLVYNKNEQRYLFVLHDGQSKTFKRRGKMVTMTEIQMLEEHLNKIPGYQFMPSYTGMPTPVVYLDKKKISGRIVHYCNSGLWKEIRDWCKIAGIEVQGPDNGLKLTDFNLTLEEFIDEVESWGLNLNPYDYQIEAAWKILHYKQSLSQMATRAGKTLVAYIIFRYMLTHGAHNILMVVPSISLVKQGVSDMAEYQDFFESEAVWAEGEYIQGANLTIGTFQSLVKRCCKGKKGAVNKHYNPKFFDKFDVICIDECHKAECESIKQILSQPFMKNAKLRFGFSGTLPEPNTIESYGVQALLGPCIQDITSDELINRGFLARPNITQIYIKYKDDAHLTNEYCKYGEYLCSMFATDENGDRIKLAKDQRDMTMIYEKKLPIAVAAVKRQNDPMKYREFLIDLCKAQGANLLNLEQMIAEHSPQKMETIDNLVFSWDKNGIIFAHNEAYIDYLYNHLTERFPDRNVYRIKGSTPDKRRDKIKQAMNTTDTNAILVASYGCVGTGLTFKNIDYCIFAQSFKSRIINMQSIGRGLLLKDDKEEFFVYDIIDCLPTERLKKHGEAKQKIYEKAKYPCRVVKK